ALHKSSPVFQTQRVENAKGPHYVRHARPSRRARRRETAEGEKCVNMNDIVIGYMSPQPSCEAERDLIEPGAPPEVDVAGVSRAGNKLVERHVQPRARTIVVSCGYG